MKNRRLNRLGRELGLGRLSSPCALDPEQVCRDVRGILAASDRERKRLMKHKLKITVILAAAIFVLCGTAFAVARNLDVLQAWFDGDTSSAEDLVDYTARSVSDGNYTFTVGSSISDGQTAFLLVRIDALSEAGRAKLNADDFVGIDTFSTYPLVEDAQAGGLVPGLGTTGYSEVTEERTETSRTWRADMDLSGLGDSAVAVRVRLGYMDEGLAVVVPLAPADGVTVQIGATGQGYPDGNNTSGSPITVERAVVSPLTLSLDLSWPEEQDDPPFLPVLFRMADGSLRSFCQMINQNASGQSWSNMQKYATFVYYFREVQDRQALSGIVLWGVEYPLDGGAPREVEVDEKLLPFTIPVMPGLSEDIPTSLSIQDLCEGLGASCVWGGGGTNATLTYRDSSVVLTQGSATALVDGAAVELQAAADLRGGRLCADTSLLRIWNLGLRAAFNGSRERVCFLVIP